LVSAVAAAGDSVYANGALYANLGGDPVYSNIAEVRDVPCENSIILDYIKNLLKKNFDYLQANEAQALLEVPVRSGLAGRTADAVARGLDRVQTSSRQPLPGLRPLGLSMEVGFFFFYFFLWDPLVCVRIFVLDPQNFVGSWVL
jgi:hypothetical protein